MHLSEVEPPIECSITRQDAGEWYYHVILLHFTVAARVAKRDGHNRIWEDHLTKYACTFPGRNLSAIESFQKDPG
jgi:hypothetical protein